MARTASMTVAQAEALIGSASSLIVTAENRPLLRKWAVAFGLTSEVAYAMSNVELANMYATNAGTMPAPTYYGPVVPAPMPAATGNAADQLAAALRIIMGPNHAVLNEDRVREIIAETPVAASMDETRVAEIAREILNDARVTRIEISGPSGINAIEGIVHGETPDVIRTAALGHSVMLVGPAGCGKTSIGNHVAIALGLPLYITSTVFDTHELMGFVDGAGKYHSTPFRQAFEHGGVWVADEIDAWDAAALLAANSALANGYASFPDSQTPVLRHANFRVIATANTFGHGADRQYVGRNELDAASLDRFATFAIDYDDALETALNGGNFEWQHRVTEVRNICRDKNIRHVVSTRAIIMGSQALAAGISQASVEERYLFKGMSKTDREKIR